MAALPANKQVVTVVMPVFNGEEHLASAIQSVLNQELDNWNLIIVDDCSTDRSLEIARRYGDSRIEILQMDSNGGIARALNAGIERAESAFIARLDQDDLAAPGRLSRQLAFFEKNPEVALLGTWAQFFGDGERRVMPPTKHEDLIAELLWRNPFVHSSIMFRSEILGNETGPYNPEFTGCEDYDLWQRIALNFRIGILPEFLTAHRLHQNQMTSTPEAKENERRLRQIIATRHRKALGFNPGSGLLPTEFLIANLDFIIGKRSLGGISQARLMAAFFRWIKGNLMSLFR